MEIDGEDGDMSKDDAIIETFKSEEANDRYNYLIRLLTDYVVANGEYERKWKETVMSGMYCHKDKLNELKCEVERNRGKFVGALWALVWERYEREEDFADKVSSSSSSNSDSNSGERMGSLMDGAEMVAMNR